MFLVFFLHTSTAAECFVQTTGLQTDYIQSLAVMVAGLAALEVGHRIACRFHRLNNYLL